MKLAKIFLVFIIVYIKGISFSSAQNSKLSLNLYEWKGDIWVKKTLIDTVDHGHTLQVTDIDGDGNLDIYTAEMYKPGSGVKCRQWVLYGDIDILQKDFQEERRVDVWLNEGQ